jgi:hypothetical protein
VSVPRPRRCDLDDEGSDMRSPEELAADVSRIVELADAEALADAELRASDAARATAPRVNDMTYEAFQAKLRQWRSR